MENNYDLSRLPEEVEFFGIDKITFPVSEETVTCLEKIVTKSELRDSKVIENILNLPQERMERLTKLVIQNKGIDVELASNLNLTNEQYGAHRDIAQYNYNVEYGHLKDSGYDSVDKSLISNPDLSLDQLSLIHVATTNNHTYNPQQFLDENNQILPKNQILDVMSEQRINANEVKQALKEIDRDIETLSRGELKTLNELHMNGKTDPEQSKLFYSTLNPINQVSEAELEEHAEQIASRNHEFTPEELEALENAFYEIQEEQRQSQNDNNLENNSNENRLENSEHKEGQFTSNENINNLNAQQLASKLEDDFGVRFVETHNEELGYTYYQSVDGGVDITEDSVDINNLTPEAVELAIAATAAKFGNNIIIDGSDEFKAQVIDTIANNPKFANLNILNPELQEDLAMARLQNYYNDLDLTIPKETLGKNSQVERYATQEEAIESDRLYVAKINGEYITFDNRDELVSAVVEDHNQDYKMDQDLSDSYYEAGIEEFAARLAEREQISDFEIDEIENMREQEQEYERD